MPGIIQADFNTGVMPKVLCELFSQEREYLARESNYADGSSQRGLIVFVSRRHWSLRPRIVSSAMVTLRNFYISQDGGVKAFYYYDFSESTPYGNYDPTGADANGRFLVRFDGKWDQSQTISRQGSVNIALVELLEGLGSSSSSLNFSNQNSFMFGI